MFDSVPSERLRNMADELAVVAQEELDGAFSKYPEFAAHLSILMRTELVERRKRGEQS